MSAEFKELDSLTIAFGRSLGKLKLDASGFRSLTTSANSTSRALERANLSAISLHKHLSAVTASGGSAAALLPAAGWGRSGGSISGTGGRHPPGGIHGGNIHMGSGGIGMGAIGMAAGDAFIPLAVTAALIYSGKSLFNAAKDLDSERQRFKLLGLSDAQNKDAFKFVAGLRIYGTTQTERQAAFTEAQGVGREAGLEGSRALDFAKLATPVLSRLDALGKGLDDEGKGALHASNIALLRFDEQSGGLKSAAEFERIANIGYKLRQSSGGTIDFEQLRAVTAKGGAYTQNKTAEGWAYAEPVIQELKGNAYGVGVQTAGSRLFNVMSRTPKNLIAEATKLGLWTPERQHLDEADSALFKENFEKFYIERLMPIYEKLKLSPNDRIRDNAILLGRTGGTVGNLIEKQIPSIKASWDAYQKSKSLDDATKQLPDSLIGQQKEFEAAWTDFKTEFGTTMLPIFSGILKGGSWILRRMHGDDSAPFQGGKEAEASFQSRLSSAPGRHWVEDPSVPGSGHWVSDVTPSAGGSGGSKPTVLNLHIDGQKMASVMFDPMSTLLSAPVGGANFDGSLSLAPVSLNQGH